MSNLLVYFIGFVVTALGCSNFESNIFHGKPHIAALILARGGSKGIKLKNLQKVGQNTLLGRSLIQTKLVDFDSVWVSTDCLKIAEEAEKFKVNIHWRQPETATDQASSLFATQEFLAKHPQVDIVALIQCTSPFLRRSFLEEAKTLLKAFECVFSVSRSPKLLWKGYSGNIGPVNFDPESRPRRQDLETQFVENGMFYFASSRLIRSGRFQTNSCAIVEIPQYMDIEIDNPSDLIVANMLSTFLEV